MRVFAKMELYKTPLSVRGDMLYCPLCFSLDSYWGCIYNCAHCYLRNMNKVWGQEYRVIDPEKLRKKLENGLKNKNPKSPVAYCLALKKTIRWGNKADPFQPLPGQTKLSKAVFEILYDLEWSYVIQTMNTDIMMEHEGAIVRAGRKRLATIMPVVSPGLEKDWVTFENRKTNNPFSRLAHIRRLRRQGVSTGVNGEPFIPGFHTVDDFRDTLKALRSYGIRRYNTYNFHFTPFVAHRLHNIGVDIGKIHYANKDKNWKPILMQLLDLSKKYGVLLGCPDWVNTGVEWREKANTCCGVHAKNPSRFNAHEWKRRLQLGQSPEQVLQDTWEGIGNFKEGKDVMYGTTNDKYTMIDAGFDNEK